MSEKTEKPLFSLSAIMRSEGAILTGIPFLGSLVAFVYEAGYLAFFSVPISFIQLDFVRVVTASATVMLIAAIGFWVMAVIFVGEHPICRLLTFPVCLVLIFGPIFLLYPSSWRFGPFLLLLGGCTFIFLISLVPPLFTRSKGGTYNYNVLGFCNWVVFRVR